MKKIFSKRKIIIFALIIFGLFIFLSFSFAKPKCPQIEWPRSPTGTSFGARLVDGKCKYDDFTNLIKYLYEWGIAIGGIVLFFILILAGFQYLTSFGNPKAMEEAKDRLKSGFFGLILLLGSWLILNTINPKLTKFQPLSFNPGRISQAMVDCDADRDCQKLGPQARCLNDPKMGDGKKEGICFSFQPKAPICDRVVLYSEPKFGGNNVGSISAGAGCKPFAPWFLARMRGGVTVQSTRGFVGDLKDGQCYLFSQKTDRAIKEIKTCEEAPTELNDQVVNCRCIKCGGAIQFFNERYCNWNYFLGSYPPTNEYVPITGEKVYGAIFYGVW